MSSCSTCINLFVVDPVEKRFCQEWKLKTGTLEELNLSQKAFVLQTECFLLPEQEDLYKSAMKMMASAGRVEKQLLVLGVGNWNLNDETLSSEVWGNEAEYINGKSIVSKPLLPLEFAGPSEVCWTFRIT